MKIKMLGNHLEFENGKEYEVDAAAAAQLTGIGIAIAVNEDIPAADKAEAEE